MGVHRVAVRGERGAGGALERRVVARRILRHGTAAVVHDHRERARHEIAERVGQLGRVAGVEALPREIAVALEADLAQQEIPQRVRAVALDRLVQRHYGAGGLAHLGAGPLHVAVRPHGAGQRQLGGEQHRGPDHAMEPRDALADHVQVRGPQPLESRVGESRGRQIIDQRVEPDVHRLLGVAGERDAPGEPLARDGNVLQARLEQAQHFVAPDLGLDRERARPNALEHRVAVGAQAEEVIALLGRDQLQRRMLDAMPVHDLRAGLKLLAASAVQTLVLGLEQVLGVVLLDALQQSGDAADVTRLGGANPVVVAAPQPLPVSREHLRHPVHPCLRRHLRARGGLDHGLAVLVHPHQEVDVVLLEAAIARDAVGPDFLERVAQVGVAVGIIDRGGEVELRHRRRSLHGRAAAGADARSEAARSRRMHRPPRRGARAPAVQVLVPPAPLPPARRPP